MLHILFENKSVVVCEKPVGVLSERGTNPRERCMPALLEAQTRTWRIDTVHRLDKGVGGLIVYSKKAAASASLSKQIASRGMVKEYLAAVTGRPAEEAGEWRDWLFRDKSKNKSFAVKGPRQGAKEAILSYRVLQTVTRGEEQVSLLLIRLHTGRTHQIRVQCASRGMPLLGDGKYGSRADLPQIALWSHHLAFTDPETGKPADFTLPPPKSVPWTWFGCE